MLPLVVPQTWVIKPQDLFGNEEILLETIDEIRRNLYRTEKLYSIYAGDSFPRDPESIRNGLNVFYFIMLPTNVSMHLNLRCH